MSDTSEIRVLQLFKKNLIDFLDELRSQLPHEPDLVIARIFLKDQVPLKDVMEFFVHKLVSVREQITARDEQYFMSNNSIFAQIENGKVNNFKRIWRSGLLDKETKEVVWKWVDSFVISADKYAKIIQATSS